MPSQFEPDRRGLLRGLVAVAATAPLLAACGEGGFRPMYGATGTTGQNLSDVLAGVDVAPIPGRTGQQIRNELIFKTRGGGNPAPQQYRLEVAFRQSVQSILVQRTGDAKGQVLSLEATFKLINLADKKVALEGKSHSRAAFEKFESIYTNLRARRDAENRAAKIVANGIHTRVAAFLSNAG